MQTHHRAKGSHEMAGDRWSGRESRAISLASRSMKKRYARAMRAAVLAILSGCGGGGGALTCELLAEPDNCWAEAASAFAACLPQPQGVLAPDRASCTFPDGVRVVFEPALPVSGLDLDHVAVTVLASGGDECGRFVDTGMNRQELTAGGETVTGELRGGEFHLRCGDDELSTSFDALLQCPPPLPSAGLQLTSTGVTFIAASAATPMPVFRCDS